jgi:hypothetical protein
MEERRKEGRKEDAYIHTYMEERRIYTYIHICMYIERETEKATERYAWTGPYQLPYSVEEFVLEHSCEVLAEVQRHPVYLL